MAELFVVINRKVSADKQKDQVPDGIPNCKEKYKPPVYYVSFFHLIPQPLNKTQSQAAWNKLSQGSPDLVLHGVSPWGGRISLWDLDILHWPATSTSSGEKAAFSLCICSGLGWRWDRSKWGWDRSGYQKHAAFPWAAVLTAFWHLGKAIKPNLKFLYVCGRLFSQSFQARSVDIWLSQSCWGLSCECSCKLWGWKVVMIVRGLFQWEPHQPDCVLSPRPVLPLAELFSESWRFASQVRKRYSLEVCLWKKDLNQYTTYHRQHVRHCCSQIGTEECCEKER